MPQDIIRNPINIMFLDQHLKACYLLKADYKLIYKYWKLDFLFCVLKQFNFGMLIPITTTNQLLIF